MCVVVVVVVVFCFVCASLLLLLLSVLHKPKIMKWSTVKKWSCFISVTLLKCCLLCESNLQNIIAFLLQTKLQSMTL